VTYDLVKRILDVGIIIIFSPAIIIVCLITAMAIKIESPSGPVFADIPKRVGKNFAPFFLYKFRSMIPNAHYLLRTDPKFKELFEEYKKSSYKLHSDPRWTKVGKVIRKYSIDEIPQVINVLRGEMSLVGPRPYFFDELETQQQKYPHTKELIKVALSTPPGMTGEWQVSGRSDINFDKRIEMDAHYAKTKSLWYDLLILLKTPFAALSGKGAV